MSDEERRSLNADLQSLNVSLGSLITARNNLIYQQTTEGEFSDDTHAELESEVRTMFEELHGYREHDAVVETWQQFQMDQIPALCARRRTVENNGVGHFGIGGGGTETQIERAPVDHLITWTRGFKRILKQLGLTVPVKHGLDSTDVTHDDLAALLEARGQTDAREHANVD